MKRLLITFLLLATAAGMVCLESISAGDEIALLDAPRGAWLGTLRGDVTLTVIEQRDGWQRVRIEGWVAGSGAPAAAPSTGAAAPVTAAVPGIDGIPADSTPPPAGVAGTRVRGVLRPAEDAKEAAPGAGLVVLLVPDDEALAGERAAAEQSCRAGLREVDQRIASLEQRRRQALNSSDNFRQATSENDRVRAELAQATKERGEQVRRCRQEAEAVFLARALQRSISDAAGRFEFERVTPGRYRVVATDATIDPPRFWVLDCRVSGEREIVLDQRADRSGDDPYWGVR